MFSDSASSVPRIAGLGKPNGANRSQSWTKCRDLLQNTANSRNEVRKISQFRSTEALHRNYHPSMPAPANILVLHGPNLNLLGEREPEQYGSTTLDAINKKLAKRAAAAGVALTVYQTNIEGDLVSRIQQARNEAVDFIIINPAAFTHTSVALRDALAAVRIPFIEVHLSNVYRREEFRRHSYVTDLAAGVISGLGAQGYDLALDYALQHSAGG